MWLSLPLSVLPKWSSIQELYYVRPTIQSGTGVHKGKGPKSLKECSMYMYVHVHNISCSSCLETEGTLINHALINC